jgi:hypothetical protein
VTLKTIRDKDMNDILLKEMLKKLNLLSYNYRQTIMNTWNNSNITNNLPKTFEEDLEQNDDINDAEEFKNIFITHEEEEDDSDSEKHQLVFTKKKKDQENVNETIL